METWNKNNKYLRIITTARDLNSINKAVKNGFKVVVIKIEPSIKIRTNYSVVQNKITGEVKVVGDLRGSYDKDEFKTLVDWASYYPHNFKSPFAAYLIPLDIKIGEAVFIEDLIEDFIGSSWNQGSNYRLEGCEAIWNGSALEIQYDPTRNIHEFIG